MNKIHHRTDEERDQHGELERKRFSEKQSGQAWGGVPQEEQPTRDGGFKPSEQQRAEQPRNRQQGGWDPEEGGLGRKPPESRDRDYDPDGDKTGDETRIRP